MAYNYSIFVAIDTRLHYDIKQFYHFVPIKLAQSGAIKLSAGAMSGRVEQKLSQSVLMKSGAIYTSNCVALEIIMASEVKQEEAVISDASSSNEGDETEMRKAIKWYCLINTNRAEGKRKTWHIRVSKMIITKKIDTKS